MEPFVRIILEKTALAPETRILKARDHQVFEQAEQVLAEAEQKALEIVHKAEQEYEAQQVRGYQDGIANAKMETAEQMLDTVSRTVDYFAQVEKKVAEVVMTSVRKILGEFDDQTLTMQVVRNALTVVRTQNQVTLRVSPGQEESLRSHLNEILQGYSGISYIEVVSDHRLQAGGCILETDVGVVDASIEVQLKALENAMTAKLHRNDE